MRETVYKARRLDDGKLIKGYYISYRGKNYILTDESSLLQEIDINTICRCKTPWEIFDTVYWIVYGICLVGIALLDLLLLIFRG